MFKTSLTAKLRRNCTRLAFEPLEVRVMLTTVKFAMIGDYGVATNSEAVAFLINSESDPKYDLATNFNEPYSPSRAVQQDFLLGAGDGRYAGNTFAGVHGHFCSYLKDVVDVNIVSKGSGYLPGLYSSVPLTGGSVAGVGATADIFVDINGQVISVALDAEGTDYLVDDQLSADDVNLGGNGGTGFAIEFAGTNCARFIGKPDANGPVSFGESEVNRFFAAPGDHEYTDGSINDFTNYFDFPGEGVESHNSVSGANASNSELYYDVVQGPVHVFVLDSELMLRDAARPPGQSVEPADNVQAAWLETGLRNSTAAWQVVVMHHPPYSSSLQGQASLQLPFAEWGVDIVLSGEDHVYERIEPTDHNSGTTFIVNGLGGSLSSSSFVEPFHPDSQSRYNDELGALFFTASEHQLSGYFRDVTTASSMNDELIDSFNVTSIPVGGAVPVVDTNFMSNGALACDFGLGIDGCDIADLDGLYASLAGADDVVRRDQIGEWLDRASSTMNEAKLDVSHAFRFGDLDFDGDVDSIDLGQLLNNFGESDNSELRWSDGDLDGDETVDAIDLGLLLNEFTG